MNRDKINRYAAFDWLKGIGCMCVVFIHVLFPGKFGKIVAQLAGFAVPSFLMISGYLASERFGGNTEERLKKRANKAFKLSLFACGFYFCYTLALKIMNGGVAEWIRQFISVKKWIDILLLSDFECIAAGHLWYLPSLFIVYLIVLFIDRHKSNPEKTLEVFETDKRNASGEKIGTGMGLWIVNNTVQDYGGRIDLSRNIAEKTGYYITIFFKKMGDEA